MTSCILAHPKPHAYPLSFSPFQIWCLFKQSGSLFFVRGARVVIVLGFRTQAPQLWSTVVPKKTRGRATDRSSELHLADLVANLTEVVQGGSFSGFVSGLIRV